MIFRRNLYTLKENTVLALCLVTFCLSEHMTIKLCELLSSSYEPDFLFKIWSSVHLFGQIFFIIFKNIYVLVTATKEFPEFLGHYGKPFPGRMKPRLPKIILRKGEFQQMKCVNVVRI